MKNLKLLLLAVLLVGFTSSAAMAEEGKVYAAVDYGQANVPDGCVGVPSSGSCNSTTTAYRFGLGFQFDKNVGFEVGYLNAGKIAAKYTTSGVPVTADATMSGFQFSAIGAYPISNEVALFGKAGFASITGKSTVSASGVTITNEQGNSNFTFGFGARFKANEKIAIRVTFEDFGTIKTSSTSSGSKVTLLSAGMQVGF